MQRQGSLFAVAAAAFLFTVGCASNNKKSELRDKVVQQSGFLCEFINGDQHRQVEMELNVLMAKRCDTEKPYSITNYKTSAEVNGVLYCCRVKDQKESVKEPVVSKPVAPVTPAAAAPTSSKPAEVKKSVAPAANAKKPADKAADIELDVDIEPAK